MPRGHVFPAGHVVAVLRGEAGLTQDELAMRAGYGLRTIGKIESSQPTTSPTLAAVATVLSDTLGREVQLADLLSPQLAVTRDFVGEHVQWLELQASSATLTETIAYRDQPLSVRRCTENIAAPDGTGPQCFRTGVEQPTDCLTLLAHFTAERAFKLFEGVSSRRSSQPIELLPGRLVFWRIASPIPGEIYELRWTT
ncbi:MAG TPA: helix-turn-helix transcriptional regulator [Pirellulales bacterium]|jgi:transcriptional regulator with XRE-family HTH domain|nr:helix-turn-helix transcriptional regulator [Pirellulales bacterium]